MSTQTHQFILGTAGHIDHGKTALVRALTGTDTDRLPEEKRRGMTIDLGFAPLHVDGFDLGIVDVPGHERFIRNMVAGASANDLAMLVVAADDSVMPQTREHLEILRLLDIDQGVIVVTKCDLVTDEFLELVDQEVRELVSGTFLELAPVVHASAVTRRGIDELRTVLAQLCRRVESRPAGDLFRMAVDRCFVVQGRGTVVTGSVVSGSVRVGDEVHWLPPGKTVRVRHLESHGTHVDQVERGQRAAIHLHGVHHSEIVRGHELATPGFLQPTRLVTARLRLSRTIPRPLKNRATLRVHIGTAECAATVSLLTANEMTGGETGVVQLHMNGLVVAACGQPFVVRTLSPVVTLGGGVILEPTAARITRRNVDQVADLEALDSSDPARRAAAAIQRYGTSKWSDLDLCRDASLEPVDVPKITRQLADDRIVIHLNAGPKRQLRLHRDVASKLEQRLTRTLTQFHKKHPLNVELALPVLAEQLYMADDEPILVALIGRMAKTGRLTVSDGGVALPQFAPKLSRAEQKTYDKVIEAYGAAGFQPPTAADLARKFNAGEATVRQLIDLAISRGLLKHLGGVLILHADWEQKLRQSVTEELRRSGTATVSRIKQVLDTSRRFAVPMCEYLDRIGCTSRRGDQRVLKNPPAEPVAAGAERPRVEPPRPHAAK